MRVLRAKKNAKMKKNQMETDAEKHSSSSDATARTELEKNIQVTFYSKKNAHCKYGLYACKNLMVYQLEATIVLL